jgi:HPt (histidine-containing phosphotransfer) domain-containing protein
MDYKFIKTEYLDSVSEGNPEIIREIVMIFKDQTFEIYNEMIRLFSEKKHALLGLQAHKAKSSVAIMGMNDLSMMLKTFEHLAKEGKEEGLYESYISRFKADTDEAIIELEDLVNSLYARK